MTTEVGTNILLVTKKQDLGKEEDDEEVACQVVGKVRLMIKLNQETGRQVCCLSEESTETKRFRGRVYQGLNMNLWIK